MLIVKSPKTEPSERIPEESVCPLAICAVSARYTYRAEADDVSSTSICIASNSGNPERKIIPSRLAKNISSRRPNRTTIGFEGVLFMANAENFLDRCKASCRLAHAIDKERNHATLDCDSANFIT